MSEPDDTNKIFGEAKTSNKLEPSPELVRVLEDSLAVATQAISARVRTLVSTLAPLVEQLRKQGK